MFDGIVSSGDATWADFAYAFRRLAETAIGRPITAGDFADLAKQHKRRVAMEQEVGAQQQQRRALKSGREPVHPRIAMEVANWAANLARNGHPPTAEECAERFRALLASHGGKTE